MIASGTDKISMIILHLKRVNQCSFTKTNDIQRIEIEKRETDNEKNIIVLIIN